MLCILPVLFWLWQTDLNRRISEPKSDALPLGDATISQKKKHPTEFVRCFPYFDSLILSQIFHSVAYRNIQPRYRKIQKDTLSNTFVFRIQYLLQIYQRCSVHRCCPACRLWRISASRHFFVLLPQNVYTVKHIVFRFFQP